MVSTDILGNMSRIGTPGRTSLVPEFVELQKSRFGF